MPLASGRQPFFTIAQILSLEIIEGPAVQLKHTVVITITYNREHLDVGRKIAESEIDSR